jgi:hypothetical protein
MAWEALFRAYIDFYQRTEPLEMYDRASLVVLAIRA